MAPSVPAPEPANVAAKLQHTVFSPAPESAVFRTPIEMWKHIVEDADESNTPIFLKYELASYGVSRKSSIDDEARSGVKTLLSLRKTEHFLGEMAGCVLLNDRPYFFSDLNQLAWFYDDCAPGRENELWEINVRGVYSSTTTPTPNDKTPAEIWGIIEAAGPRSLTLLPVYQPVDTLFGRAYQEQQRMLDDIPISLLGTKVKGEYVVRYHMQENLEVLGLGAKERHYAGVLNDRFEKMRRTKLGLEGGLTSWRAMGLSDTPV
ncbi:hypothetical protein BU16DRAFT_554121 [Lophium mytilinum]|uniref:Uncharacterized protein n=1 Tax=Lophium mytilinum TaxID=390894 RepID=A0A6A6RE96_9PEZI|nr:hypothetical protein BU16DRAFT_554121 [Lophium mytilinum]